MDVAPRADRPNPVTTWALRPAQVVGDPELAAHERRLFVMWSGLKGAVPILLASFAVLGAVEDAERIYGIVFVVVAFSVVLQGATIPYAARRFGIEMR